MTKLILKGNNIEEIKEKVSKTIFLEKDEEIVIRTLKEPKKIWFLNFSGEFEINIVKKENNKENKKENKKEIKNNSLKQNKKTQELSLSKNTKRINILLKEFLALSNLDIKISNIKEEHNTFIINLEGNDVKLFTREKGIGISSLEYLFMSLDEFKNFKVYFDSNNFKDRREKTLRELAIKTANTVLKTNRKYKLNPMPSRERRIIHEEISKIDGLETISIGQEPKRCLVIRPKLKK